MFQRTMKQHSICFTIIILSLYSVVIVTTAMVSLPNTLTATPQTQSLDQDQKKSLERMQVLQQQNENVKRYQKQIILKNLQKITQHNSAKDKAYQLGVNQFIKLSQDEANRVLFTLIPSKQITIKFSKTLLQQVSKQQEQTLPNESASRISSIPPSNARANFILPNDEAQLSLDNDVLLELQNPILNILKDHLQKQGLAEQQISETLKKYSVSNRTTSSPSSSSNGRRRILQSLAQIKYKFSGRGRFKLGQTIASLQKYNVDWTCVSGNIRYQGLKCGSCYAFATADAFSMVLAIYKFGFYVSMSVQELLQCQKNTLSLGCSGGLLEGPYTYMTNPGLIGSSWYPYQEYTQFQGRLDDCKPMKRKRYKIRNFYGKLQNDCNAVRIKLLDQPMAIGIAGTGLQLYRKGIFNGCRQDDPINHAVVLIGYEYGKGWKIKNSWGPSWGQRGYGWIADGNTCRICELSFAIELEDQKGHNNYMSQTKIRSCS